VGQLIAVRVLAALLGVGLILAGVALWSPPAALILAGVFVLATIYIDAYLRSPKDGGPR
jgi:hypothetical protein